MNPLPPNADELVSAYIDGQAAPDEIAVVESSPELMERVEALRSVSDLLGAPVEAPTEQKEAHISAALDAFDAMFSNEAAPRLSAVPPLARESEEPKQSGAVTSLSDARERRRPRRFNTGVIAAAVAAVLLFVAVAAFGLSGGSTETALDGAVASDESTDAVESAAMDDEEEAMDDDSGSALSELQSAAPAPTAAAGAEARVESAEAMADEAMDDEESMADEESMDDEEAMEDEESAADFDSADAAGDATDPPTFGFAEFDSAESLLAELMLFTTEELDQQAQELEQGLFPSCQAEIEELAQLEAPTLIAQTIIDDTAIEIHRVLDESGENAFVLVDLSCMILPTTP